LFDAGTDDVFAELHVRIDNHHVSATGFADAKIPLRATLWSDVVDLVGIGAGNLLGIVGRAVVDDNRLDMDIRLIGNRGQTGVERRRIVVGGDYH